MAIKCVVKGGVRGGEKELEVIVKDLANVLCCWNPLIIWSFEKFNGVVVHMAQDGEVEEHCF